MSFRSSKKQVRHKKKQIAGLGLKSFVLDGVCFWYDAFLVFPSSVYDGYALASAFHASKQSPPLLIRWKYEAVYDMLLIETCIK